MYNYGQENAHGSIYSRISCEGHESSLFECKYSVSNYNCYEHASVRCSKLLMLTYITISYNYRLQ